MEFQIMVAAGRRFQWLDYSKEMLGSVVLRWQFSRSITPKSAGDGGPSSSLVLSGTVNLNGSVTCLRGTSTHEGSLGEKWTLGRGLSDLGSLQRSSMRSMELICCTLEQIGLINQEALLMCASVYIAAESVIGFL